MDMVPRITIQRPSVSSNDSFVAWDGMRNGFVASGVRADDAGDWRRSQDVDDEEGIWREGGNFEIERKSRGGERMKWWKVYAMHFLFMWNSRTYEYVSVSSTRLITPQACTKASQIFLVALAFPGGLTATSIRFILLRHPSHVLMEN